MAGPDSSCVSDAWGIGSHSTAGFWLIGAALALGTSTHLHCPLSHHPEPTRLNCSLTSSCLSHRLLLPFQSRNYLRGFFSFFHFSFSEVRLLPLCDDWIPKFCAVLQSGQVCSASDRYLLKFLLFQCFIPSAGILGLYYYVSLSVLAWSRPGRGVCVCSLAIFSWRSQIHVAEKPDPGGCSRSKGAGVGGTGRLEEAAGD